MIILSGAAAGKNSSPYKILIIIGIILIIIFIIDLVISIVTLCEIKISSNKYTDHDATEEIKFLVREKIKKGSFFITRLLNAFPSIGGKDMKKVINLKKVTNEIRRRLKQQNKK